MGLAANTREGVEALDVEAAAVLNDEDGGCEGAGLAKGLAANTGEGVEAVDVEAAAVLNDEDGGCESFQSLSAPPESTDEPDDPFSSLFSFDGMRESVHQLREKLEDFCKEEIKKISDRADEGEVLDDDDVLSLTLSDPAASALLTASPREQEMAIEEEAVTFTNMNLKTRNDFLQYSHQLTLDLNTVNKLLCLSERKRVITNTGTVQPYPDHPDRFDYYRQVLCRESVSGRCYWEIEWRGDYVGISVSYKSISRKGRGIECGFGYNDQSWSLDCSSSSYSFIHNKIHTDLPVKSISSRIGVYVDHSAGTLSFYSVSDTKSLIHTVQTTFTQPLYPGIWSVSGWSSTELSSSTPRMHTYKRTSSPRSPTNTGELFTPAHEENVRFIHDTWLCVLRDIKSPQNSERNDRGPQEYVEKNPNPNLHFFCQPTKSREPEYLAIPVQKLLLFSASWTCDLDLQADVY
ncbi:Mapk-regulated corepressor-interacting protein 1 [Anabarilius grahami]|uniref:Mapk-regulated corepressor-interacting protein 1 n=1 Tax=Anabarilius grahami TaxID=495550 RepID=A0A3N0YU83_ANAGA|nr:Mapk-regulated corepressor-interacting protein 1 [Anabarilius grahami]